MLDQIRQRLLGSVQGAVATHGPAVRRALRQALASLQGRRAHRGARWLRRRVRTVGPALKDAASGLRGTGGGDLDDLPAQTRFSLHRTILAGATVTGVLVFGLGGWAATTNLAGAVLAPGQLVVDGRVKKIQHPTGGVVGELLVRDGDAVKAGAVLMRLDAVATSANLAMVRNGIAEFASRQARLLAEQGGRDAVVFPPELAARADEPAIRELMDGELRLFDTRRAARLAQKAQMSERVEQLREQIQGLNEQVTGKKREIQLVESELAGVRDLWSKNLVPVTRVSTLERDAARLQGEHGQLLSTMAQTRGKITETEQQRLQIDQDLRTEVNKEMGEVRSRLADLGEKRIAAEDQLQRLELRAPTDGVVHQLAVHTVGGVIAPGEPVMVLVPKADLLTIEARIAPQEIDQVRVGQPTIVVFPAFNRHTTPELNAQVSFVSADVTQDQKSGNTYYTVRITPSAEELTRLEGLKLVPGMPVESFIRTDDRKVISYLTKPLTDQMRKTWRER
jgi:HlyD family secretion protein